MVYLKINKVDKPMVIWEAWLSCKESAFQCRRCRFDPNSGKSIEEGMATPSSILAWKILWTGKPDGLQSMGLQRVKHT